MDRTVVRTFGRNSVQVATVHPQYGKLDRGRVVPVRGRVEGAGAYGAWELVDPDHAALDLLVVGDYLTAEQALLDHTAWADEPASPNDLDEE